MNRIGIPRIPMRKLKVVDEKLRSNHLSYLCRRQTYVLQNMEELDMTTVTFEISVFTESLGHQKNASYKLLMYWCFLVLFMNSLPAYVYVHCVHVSVRGGQKSAVDPHDWS